ncbi:MAG: hypothetical protein WEF50_05800 [Myxococcota bacterium]
MLEQLVDLDRYPLQRDALGELAIPADALWGIHTARALAASAPSR